ncbi:MAG TPA: hypothetical protein VLS45_00230, partial [Methylomicrobium sp.]|nr:hypothetical protein [Methylomicrobium sp.]
IKAALAEGKSFRDGVRQTLAAYRTTAHSTTGVSPASLMLTFSVRTPISVLSPVTSAGRSTTFRLTDVVEKRVRFQQKQAARAHDRRTRAAPTLLTAGDWVRIRLPRRGHKLAPVYSEPQEVTKVSGNCVVLRNGQRWNLRRCLRHRAIIRSPSAVSVQPGEQTSTCHATSSPPGGEPDDAAEFIFPAQSTVPAAAAAGAFHTTQSQAVAADRPVPRRSQRIRRPRDFGPFVKY